MVYDWEILKLGTKSQVNGDGDTLEDAVIFVSWRKVATDLSGNVAKYLGKTTLTAEQHAAADFVALNDLTEEIVLGWVQGAIDAEHEERINTALQNKINKMTMVTRDPTW